MSLLRNMLGMGNPSYGWLMAATLAGSLFLIGGEAIAETTDTVDYSAMYDTWKQRVYGHPGEADPYVQQLYYGGYNPFYWPGPRPVGNGYYFPPANYPYRFWYQPYRSVPAP